MFYNFVGKQNAQIMEKWKNYLTKAEARKRKSIWRIDDWLELMFIKGYESEIYPLYNNYAMYYTMTYVAETYHMTILWICRETKEDVLSVAYRLASDLMASEGFDVKKL